MERLGSGKNILKNSYPRIVISKAATPTPGYSHEMSQFCTGADTHCDFVPDESDDVGRVLFQNGRNGSILPVDQLGQCL